MVSCCNVLASPLCLSLRRARCGEISCIFFDALSCAVVRGYKTILIKTVKAIIENPREKGIEKKLKTLKQRTKMFKNGQTKMILKILGSVICKTLFF